jgi:DNA-binding IclR family transcriptional regulator
VKQQPTYPIESVDRALVILHVLRDQGSVSIAEIARELKVAPSTAHRLLAMLVYRDFAERDDRQRYVPGPALAVAPGPGARVAVLRRVVQPHLETLMARIGETVNLSVRVGTQIRIVAAAETNRPLHVGNQLGSVLPAELTSGGMAELAQLDWSDVETLYADSPLSAADLQVLRRRLVAVRRAGFAINPGRAEEGVHGVGVCVLDSAGAVVGALAVAMPSIRFHADAVPGMVALLRSAAAEARPHLRTA